MSRQKSSKLLDTDALCGQRVFGEPVIDGHCGDSDLGSDLFLRVSFFRCYVLVPQQAAEHLLLDRVTFWAALVV